MDGSDQGVARRTVLMSASAGVGASLVSGLAPAHAESASAAAVDGPIWSAE